MTDLGSGRLAEDLLLRICANPEADHAARIAALPLDEWASVVDLAVQTRTAPLLHDCLRRLPASPVLPEPAQAQLSEAVKWYTFTALRQSVALSRAVQVLAAHGLHPVALKGPGLAHLNYPAPQLRPMRDIDLLLDRDEAARAQALLLESGTRQVAPWSQHMDRPPDHHLQALFDEELATAIEIHHRLSDHREWRGEAALRDRIVAESQQMVIAGTPVRVPSPQANLLHLVEHAALQHMFDNGPLTLADIHYLARDEAIDWPDVIAWARELGLFNGLQLLAAIASRLGAGWMPEELLDEDFANRHASWLDRCCAAMFRTSDEIEESKLIVRLARGSGGGTGLFHAVRKALSPDQSQLAHLAGTARGSVWRWRGYPAWLADRGRRYLAALRSGGGAEQHARNASLAEWLDEA